MAGWCEGEAVSPQEALKLLTGPWSPNPLLYPTEALSASFGIILFFIYTEI